MLMLRFLVLENELQHACKSKKVLGCSTSVKTTHLCDDLSVHLFCVLTRVALLLKIFICVVYYLIFC